MNDFSKNKVVFDEDEFIKYLDDIIDIYLNNEKNNGTLTIKNIVFTFDAEIDKCLSVIMKDLRDLSDYPMISFNNCLFKAGAIISYDVRIPFPFEVYFVNCDFENQLFISQTKFSETVVFTGCNFIDSINIDECIFEKKLKISKIENIDEICLNQSKCDVLELTDIILNKLSLADIECAGFSIQILVCDDVVFQNIIINKFFSVEHSGLAHLELRNFYLDKPQFKLFDVDIEFLDRETAKTIKREAYQTNDNILAMDYKVREMNEYMKEMRHWKSAGTYLVLWLNKWSNYYGKYWWLGILFTLVCWVFFFSLFVIFRDGWGDTFIWSNPEYMKEAVSYLWLLDGLNEISKCNTMNWWMIVFFILGKVMIAYGIYQTVSAFRRFGK